MGASDRDMQRGTIPSLRIKIDLILRVSWERVQEEENPYLLSFNTCFKPFQHTANSHEPNLHHRNLKHNSIENFAFAFRF